MRKYVWIAVAVAAVACCSCRSRAVTRQVAGTVLEVSDSAVVSLRKDTFDMGRLREGERIVKEFAVRNAGRVPFVIGRVESDCGCIVSEYDRRPVTLGEAVSLDVSFDSRGYRGYVLKKVEVTTTLRSEPFVFFLEARIE